MADDATVAGLPRAAERPCGTCPYRIGVPAGIWHPDEYAKLPDYDGETWQQTRTRLFLCHKNSGDLCAGWLACHGPSQLLAVRLHPVDPSVFDYVSPVPVFKSGRDACAHGMSGVARPSDRAKRAIVGIERHRAKKPLVPKQGG